MTWAEVAYFRACLKVGLSAAKYYRLHMHLVSREQHMMWYYTHLAKDSRARRLIAGRLSPAQVERVHDVVRARIERIMGPEPEQPPTQSTFAGPTNWRLNSGRMYPIPMGNFNPDDIMEMTPEQMRACAQALRSVDDSVYTVINGVDTSAGV